MIPWQAWALALLVLLALGGIMLTRSMAWKRLQLQKASRLAAADRVDEMIHYLERNRDRSSVVEPLTNALVYFLIRSGRFDEAERVVVQAIEKGDRSAASIGQLGYISAGRGDAVQAEQYYRKAMEKDPSLKATLAVNLAGLLLERRERLDEAEELLCEALELRQGSARSGVHVNLALLHLERREPRDALVHAMTGYELLSSSDLTRGPRAQALALAARASRLLGEGTEAIDLARKAMKLVGGLPGWEKLHGELAAFCGGDGGGREASS